jgi:hypothetical protein
MTWDLSRRPKTAKRNWVYDLACRESFKRKQVQRLRNKGPRKKCETGKTPIGPMNKNELRDASAQIKSKT